MKRADLRLGGICHGNKGMRPCRKGAGLPFWVRMAGNGCLLFVMLVAGMGMAGCSEEQEGIVGELTPIGDSEALFRDGITFSFIGGEETLAFTTNSSWEAAVVQTEDAADTWCWLSRGSGEAGEVNLTVRAEENGGAERTASIVVSMGEVERVIPVKQTGNGTVVLHVEQAGELPSLIGEEMKYRVQDLTLSGELNGTDIRFIREMAGTDSTHCALKVLDLTDARLVEGGEPYYTNARGVDYTTKNDTISDYLLRNCISLKEVRLPKTVRAVGNFAFFNCDGIVSLDIPEGVTKIGNRAFGLCDSLVSVKMTNNVTSINEAFYKCGRLTSVELSEKLTWISSNLFYECKSLASIVIPEGVTTIDWQAFYGCESLTSIVLPKSINSISDAAFYGCSGLVSVEIPESVTSVGNIAFYGCINLESIVLPARMNWIGHRAFYRCKRLKSIVLPEGITSIGEATFGKCFDLTSVVIPRSVTSVGRSAFQNCSSLTSIVIPEGVERIEDETFRFCESLNSVVLPEGIESIGSSAFSQCSSLASIEIPEGVTSIEYAVFVGCSSLTSIEIPENITSIGNYAFSACSSLQEMHLKPTVPPVVEGGAYSSIWHCTLYVPQGSLVAYRQAAFWNGFKEIIEE